MLTAKSRKPFKCEFSSEMDGFKKLRSEFNYPSVQVNEAKMSNQAKINISKPIYTILKGSR